MFQPGTTITVKPELNKLEKVTTYKVNSINPDGNYNLTELDYSTMKPIVNGKKQDIIDKFYIEYAYQPLMEGGKRSKTRRTRKTKTRRTRRSKTRRTRRSK
jgi:hypothetical protein